MIIGLVGFKGSGKDTVANILQEVYGFERDSFAKPLKDSVASIFGWNRDMVEGSTAESREWREQIDPCWSSMLGRDITPRAVLQEIGTEVFRNGFNKNIWTSSFIYRNAPNKDENIVISDVRFTNEMTAILACDGILLRVKRGDEPKWFTRLQEYIDIYGDDEELEDRIQNQEFFTERELGSRNYTAMSFPHRSEWDWAIRSDLIFKTIDNNGSIDDLRNKIIEIVSNLK